VEQETKIGLSLGLVNWVSS